MNLMLPTARRKDGEKQPCIKIWKFDLRIPFVHYEWEIPEMIQACVVFMTGSAATAYLQDLFGFTFEMALSGTDPGPDVCYLGRHRHCHKDH